MRSGRQRRESSAAGFVPASEGRIAERPGNGLRIIFRPESFVFHSELLTGMTAFEFNEGAVHVFSVVGVVGIEHGQRFFREAARGMGIA